MATITITIPDTLVPRLTAAARASFPEYAALTPAATFKAITIEHWRGILKNYESGTASIAAIDKALLDSTGIV